MKTIIPLLLACTLLLACNANSADPQNQSEKEGLIAPTLITDAVPNDSDDPAIWVHPADPSKSLILGVDKVAGGGIYAFDLSGKMIVQKTITPVGRPNNIDIEYGLPMGDTTVDIAVFTERLAEKIRVISLPDMRYIDGGGITVFEGEPEGETRAPMGIALYKDPTTGLVDAIVSRKTGPVDGTYLWQYRLQASGDSVVTGEVVRKFGQYTGTGEIEAIMVDDALGYVYYSDEASGVRKYRVHADSGTQELALFGQADFQEDREGIALWPTSDSTGFIIVSDQQKHTFNVYPREGEGGKPHAHTLLKVWPLSTIETDGCEVYAGYLSETFPRGIFVAMTEGGTYQVYDLRSLEP